MHKDICIVLKDKIYKYLSLSIIYLIRTFITNELKS